MVEAYDGRIFDYTQSNDIVDGAWFNLMQSIEIAITASHLKAIKYWYYTTDEDFAVFMEDDMNLEMSEYWGFTWQELISAMPQNWKSLQMNLIKDYSFPTEIIKFNRRDWGDWGAGCYAISRPYAKELLDIYFQNGKFHLVIEICGDLIPFAENALFVPAKQDAYVFPIFIEEITLPTTFYPKFCETPNKCHNETSAKIVLDWWKAQGKNKTIKDFI